MNYAIFILTHGRPNRQKTLETLLKTGYTGKWYLILDDTDKTIQEYIDKWGTGNIIVFDKNHYINSCDVGTNNPSPKCILYAKCAAEDIAENLGLDAFIIADDDIKTFRFRCPEGDKLPSTVVNNCMQDIIDSYMDYMLSANLSMTGLGCDKYLIGGICNFKSDSLSSFRIPYNFVFRNAKYKVEWKMMYGEDSIVPQEQNMLGNPTIAVPYVQFGADPVGHVSKSVKDGGMSELYKKMSGFKLNTFLLMYYPSMYSFKEKSDNIVCSFHRENAFPKIISNQYRKNPH